MGRAGFTLIEVLVALAIVAIALLAIVKASTSNIRHAERLRHHVEAVWVAQDILSQQALGLISKGQTVGEMTVLKHRYSWQLSSVSDGRFSKISVRDETGQLISMER